MKKFFLNGYRLLTLVSLASLLIISCSQEENDIINNKDLHETINSEIALDKYERMIELSKKPQRTEREAVKLLGEFINLTQTYSLTAKKAKNKHLLDIENVRYIIRENEPKTYFSKSENYVQTVDTALYVFNFKNNNGFAIISGDKRVADILAFTENGNLNDSDMNDIEDTGLAVYLSRLPVFFKEELDRFSIEKDSLEEVIDEPETYRRKRRTKYSYSFTDWENVNRVPNLVEVKWNQSAPYNNEAPFVQYPDGSQRRAVTGCVSTALAQLISAHKYPSNFRGVSLDWDFLTQYPSYAYYVREVESFERYNDIVAKLHKKIGDALGNNWGSQTGAPLKNISGVLREMGYSNYSSETNFDTNAAISSIAQRKPIFLCGYSEKSTSGWWVFKKNQYDIGHAWLGDGYVNQKRTCTKTIRATGEIVDVTTENRTLIHCNWGWGGSYNGYFLPGVFDSNSPITYSGKPGNYQYKITNILYVTP